ncbi:inositol monophosphatase family protein [Bradyrhizobium elkanii]|uniref:Inositol-phosphate phosphatase/L-galactose 1-phosphate phosphatase/histidinol-phosphatase n=1 Tax=Bradyrhizobium elkanii TaxID=29448 RepID=A0ABV4F643_BRAEL|nr:inositol monophosphatase family protein [Bradyrhizobium elkanii]MBP2433706.1 myo-inositol-1(or 4)-monophosphatase [Bradyrhizobium elkanii]MCP1750489.1 myo-inositol-1(or 4)-monophosphatase [Bradyrhizobium elkanii]MCP1976265.1 myo-inositol-1(or 4)-monophosphatase [Bradyrhizobium elkanii]MCS3889219.1 myo-inositol-1(or 4)-monophosphatase [Bradyrhizobium elkanii]MCS4211760.1 myo-inositol-1(or 4)-monophosphatase [Bradyrhizobium elkanii]
MDDIQDRLSASELASFFNELADVAGRIAVTHFRSSVDFERKQDLTPVTIADRAIEMELRRLIGARFPDHGILGEEMGSTAGDRYTWYLDPIDGTKSFISGMPLFGTLVALADEKDGSVAAGMINMPALAERWYGTRQGTTFNGKQAKVSRTTRLEDAQIYTSSPDFFTPGDWARYDALSQKAMFRRFGGDCYQYGLLASGHCDLVVETSLKSFDFMALIPVVEGAGGIVRDWQGQPLSPDSDGRVIAAANDSLLEQALAILNQ